MNIFDKTIPHAQEWKTVYTYMSSRYCTYCGIKGIYGDDRQDYFTDTGEYCFKCGNTPHELYNAEYVLPKFAACESVVIDSKTETILISVADRCMNEAATSLSRSLAISFYGDGSK